jgi:hypothetical protein
MGLRVAAFVRYVVHMDAQYNFRILGSRLCPLALDNLPLFDPCKRSLHLWSLGTLHSPLAQVEEPDVAGPPSGFQLSLLLSAFAHLQIN